MSLVRVAIDVCACSVCSLLHNLGVPLSWCVKSSNTKAFVVLNYMVSLF